MDDRDRLQNRFIDLTLVVGVSLAVYGSFVMLYTSSLTIAYDLPRIYPFDFPAYQLPVALSPGSIDLTAEQPFAAWLERLFRGVVYFVTWTLYYLGLAGFVGGVFSIFLGLGSTQQAAARDLLEGVAADRRVQVLTFWLLVLLAVVGNQAIFQAFVTGSTIVVTWVGIAATLAIIAYRIRVRATSPAWVFVVYPVLVATPLISSATTALVIPWTAESALAVSYHLAIVVADLVLDLSLDAVLSMGLARTPRSVLWFWAFLTIGLGWILALLHLAMAYGTEELDITLSR